jgi:hypothetical protein
MANAPLLRRDGQILSMILVHDQSHRLRQIGTTGKSVEMEKLLSNEEQLLHPPSFRARVQRASYDVQLRI